MTGMFPQTRPTYGSYQWFQSQIGRMLPDLKPDPKQWQRDVREEVHDIINRGVQRVYVPDMAGDPTFRWSWMVLPFTFVTAADQEDYDLPENCAGIAGNLQYTASDNSYIEVVKTNYDTILRRRSLNDTGATYPAIFAELPLEGSGTEHQGMRITLWPSPSTAYTMKGLYDAIPRDITEDQPYPLGGRPMTELFLASMLAIVNPKTLPDFERRLMAAIQHDLTRRTGENLGYNGNGDKLWRGDRRSRGWQREFEVTYGGQ